MQENSLFLIEELDDKFWKKNKEKQSQNQQQQEVLENWDEMSSVAFDYDFPVKEVEDSSNSETRFVIDTVMPTMVHSQTTENQTEQDNQRVKSVNMKRTLVDTGTVERAFVVQMKRQKKSSWTEVGFIFLAYTAMNYFGIKHSLKVSRTEQEQSTGGPGTVAWRRIFTTYNQIRLRWNELKNDNLAERTPVALNKKWNSSGDKRGGSTEMYIDSEDQMSYTHLAYVKFHTYYNEDFILTCNEQQYEKLKQKYRNN